jgi:hypothetical protein
MVNEIENIRRDIPTSLLLKFSISFFLKMKKWWLVQEHSLGNPATIFSLVFISDSEE